LVVYLQVSIGRHSPAYQHLHSGNSPNSIFSPSQLYYYCHKYISSHEASAHNKDSKPAAFVFKRQMDENCSSHGGEYEGDSFRDALPIEAVGDSETTVNFYEKTRRSVLEGCHRHQLDVFDGSTSISLDRLSN
jgi:hypothetical protein